jgi:signal transduction histidine kinase
VDPVLRARAAIVMAGVVLLGGIFALVGGVWRVDLGITLAVDGDLVRIVSVGEHSPGELEGFAPGMIVLTLNGVELVKTPQYIYPTADPNGVSGDGQPLAIEPLVPTPVDLPPGTREFLVAGSVSDLTAIPQAAYEHMGPNDNAGYYVRRNYTNELQDTVIAYFAGAAFLVVGSWWLLSGRGGQSLQPLAFPLAAGVSIPLLAHPLVASWAPPAFALAGVAVPLGMLPLGLALLERIPSGPATMPIRLATIGAAMAAAVIGVARVWLPASENTPNVLWGVLSAAVPLIPGIAAAAPSFSPEARAESGGKVVQSTELAIAGVTPAVALMTGSTPWDFLFPLSLWLLVVYVAGRVTIRPLARLAVRAQLQRDLIVAATEAERARVAADIHDDALQELTLLVQRLDAAGDNEGADAARGISDRLRAICGDLRLPILDDLGVGPALDWLVTRIERLSGGKVRLERSDGERLPMDVELGIFRVAQEALANAVRHGKPPITVRYHATASGASLSVDDAGPGIEPDATTKAEIAGRLGLVNMQQRAEQIGAILDVRRWPAGGTHVALEWRAH